MKYYCNSVWREALHNHLCQHKGGWLSRWQFVPACLHIYVLCYICWGYISVKQMNSVLKCVLHLVHHSYSYSALVHYPPEIWPSTFLHLCVYILNTVYALQLIWLQVYFFVYLREKNSVYTVSVLTSICTAIPDSECSVPTCEWTCPMQRVSSKMSEKKAMLGSRVSFSLVTAGLTSRAASRVSAQMLAVVSR